MGEWRGVRRKGDFSRIRLGTQPYGVVFAQRRVEQSRAEQSGAEQHSHCGVPLKMFIFNISSEVPPYTHIHRHRHGQRASASKTNAKTRSLMGRWGRWEWGMGNVGNGEWGMGNGEWGWRRLARMHCTREIEIGGNPSVARYPVVSSPYCLLLSRLWRADSRYLGFCLPPLCRNRNRTVGRWMMGGSCHRVNGTIDAGNK